MKQRFGLTISALAFACAATMPTAHAASLLGLIGDGNSGALVTLNQGSAGSSGAVNLGLGGGGGNVLDANVGGSGGGSSLANANVSLGGASGLVDVGANVGGGLVTANVNVGGGGGLIGVDIGIGGPRTGGPGGPGGPVLLGGGGGSSFSTAAPVNVACVSATSSQLLQIFEGTRTSGWNRASNIQLVPIKLCPDIRGQLAAYLAASRKYSAMVYAVAGDPLINAALSRTRYQPGHVLGVVRNGNQLVVYVF